MTKTHKISVCFYGLPRFTNDSYKFFLRKVNAPVDVFGHIWKESINENNSLFHSGKFIIENQIQFPTTLDYKGQDISNGLSMIHSIKQSIVLALKKDNDWILLTRTDLVLFKNFNPEFYINYLNKSEYPTVFYSGFTTSRLRKDNYDQYYGAQEALMFMNKGAAKIIATLKFQNMQSIDFHKKVEDNFIQELQIAKIRTIKMGFNAPFDWDIRRGENRLHQNSSTELIAREIYGILQRLLRLFNVICFRLSFHFTTKSSK